jgi:hypothetical protein
MPEEQKIMSNICHVAKKEENIYCLDPKNIIIVGQANRA